MRTAPAWYPADGRRGALELPETTWSPWIRWGLSILVVVVPILLFARLMGNQLAVSDAESKLRPLAELVLHFRQFEGRLPNDKDELVRVEKPEENLNELTKGWGYRAVAEDQFLVYLYGPDGDDDGGEKALGPWDILLRNGDLTILFDDSGRVLKRGWD